MGAEGEQVVDTVIIGGGLMGSSLAAQLSQRNVENVLLVDFDLEGTLSSSELNAGGVRATWMNPLNVEISKRSIEYFRKHRDEVGYQEVGYLWLQSSEAKEGALKLVDSVKGKNWPCEFLDVSQLRGRASFIDKTDDLSGAVFSKWDGLINPNLLKVHFRDRSRQSGVSFRDRLWLKSASFRGEWVLEFDQYSKLLEEDQKLAVYRGESPASDKTVTLRAKRVINCAGAWASQVAKVLGYEANCRPVRRQISLFDCRDVDLSKYGMIVDTSGVYFHPEATHGLAGYADPDEPANVNFKYDGEDFFNERIWMPLFERSSYFEKLKHITGWAGLYEVSPDGSAIVGEVKSDHFLGAFEAHSFSGRGVMQCFAVADALAEKIVTGRYSDLDLSPLHSSRFDDGRLVQEDMVI